MGFAQRSRLRLLNLFEPSEHGPPRAAVAPLPLGLWSEPIVDCVTTLDLAIARYMVLAQAIGVIVAATGAWAHLWS